MNKLFVYGLLQDPAIQLKLINRTVTGRVDSLENYIVLRDYKIDSVAYPRIVRYPKGCVYGRILELTDEELQILDEFETEKYIKYLTTTKNGEKVLVYIADNN